MVATGGNTALLFAAQVGAVESAAMLIAAGADVNDAAADGNPVLVTAAHAGHAPLVELLLQHGANANAGGAGYTALHAAAMRGDLDVVTALIGRRADLDARITKPTPVRRIGPQLAFPGGTLGATPAIVAAVHLEVEVLHALVRAGANVSMATNSGITPLLAVVGVGDRQLRLTRPKDFREEEEFSDLERSEDRVVDAARLLLDRGADVNGIDTGSGDTAVHGAAAAGFSAVIQLLADRGAELSARNKRGQTPLAVAVAGQRRDSRPAAGQDGKPVSLVALEQAERLLRRLGATP